MFPFDVDCRAGFEKESKKFDESIKDLKQLRMQNYDLYDCTKECREDDHCNFIFYTVDYNKDSDIGCRIYNEPDTRARTVPIDPKKEIFCNKIQQKPTATVAPKTQTKRPPKGQKVKTKTRAMVPSGIPE